MLLLRTNLHDPDQHFDRVPSKSISLPNSVAQALLKGSKKDTITKGTGSIFELEISNDCSATMTRTDPNGTKLSLQFDPSECGSFPDYKQVLPSEDSKAHAHFWENSQPYIGFNLELTQVVMAYLKRIRGSTICAFKFIDDLSPIRSTQEIECEPCRTEYKDHEKPWLAQLTWILMPCRVTP